MIPAPSGKAGPMQALPPAVKLAVLFGLSVLLFATGLVPLLAGLAGAVLVLALLLCPAGLLAWLRAWPLLLTIALVAGWTAFFTGMEAALVILLRLGTLSLFATLVTATTPIGQFIDTITRIARPLEVLGVGNARDIGLAIGLVIRFVPEVQARYRIVAAAHRARGLRLRPATLIVPLVIGTLQSADDIADAIDARNIRAEAPKGERSAHVH